ncbi:hypothetical protein GRZ55_10890 [Chelativorans sp. ZYF759]|uniref:hypothetical protein n=1 Tax=Chelativorans sp. ZYF759 TaxID=2692213 RepID=UPI00145CEC8D|nr:hypothetical protein [Chelativorans sp. ZYF759]NMG39748.1 hypothetical protein [Chelativorans sp. ZYF759]
MQTDEPRIAITGYATSGPVAVFPESAVEAYLEATAAFMTDLPEDATPAQREARLEAIMAAYTKLDTSGSMAEASSLTTLRASADGKRLEPAKAKSMAEVSSRYWAKHGTCKANTDDGVDRSISGHGPGYDTLKRIVGAKPRPRGR